MNKTKGCLIANFATVPKKVRKTHLSGAQRAALKKARTKAHTSAAKMARRKSMRLRHKAGL
ncbi:hypothetical protein [Edwardsiella tarda]|uniref:hypothetical protein n=1 Tax=Edwardsiella tarda TaxID=636 RepID=UPI00351C60D3